MGIEGRAVYRQTKGATARPATVMLDLRGLTIRALDGTGIAAWPFAQLVRIPAGRSRLVLSAGGETGRVEFTDPATAAAFDAALRTIPEAGSIVIRRSYAGVAIGAGVFAAALVALGWWLLAVAGDLLAPSVPGPMVRSLDGAALPAVLAHLGTSADARCDDPAGVAALGRLVDRIVDAGGARDMDLDVAVYRSSTPASASLPGGTVIVTSALVERATSDDALAGVVAHEVGHVHYRHGLAALMRLGGVPTTLAMLTGRSAGVDDGLVAQMATANWDGDDELEADGFAVDAIAAGGGRPVAYADFVAALTLDAAAAGTYAGLHPLSPDRSEAVARRAADRAPRPGPLVVPADAAAIRSICREAAP
jgi:Zn-dependent protease with chaperone function